eukprot:TRINITY_DN5972_c0_g1_i1.p1 TRINITY_DN5972_c0_g1~~TRINITY_DN5972_c0_g1_i1.p1  ORF type:complete len:436 (-),score=65.47 TRINITY_DN5972_c0_g1_i1:116-1423(-)
MTGSIACAQTRRLLSCRIPKPTVSVHWHPTLRRSFHSTGTTFGTSPKNPPDASCVKDTTQRKKRIFSGIQPTGDVHLGNYFGAIANWVEMQNDHLADVAASGDNSSAREDVLFSIVDLHSLTTTSMLPEKGAPSPAKQLVKSTFETAVALLASGIDPDKCVLFVQSEVSGHAELAWILGCLSPMSWLQSMIQFKEKSALQEDVNLGLLSYPVLMTADVLLYRATHVPVGEVQTQRITLARDIAHRFNRVYDEDRERFGPHAVKGAMHGDVRTTGHFPLPEGILTATKRVMSLSDGRRKMSKSVGTNNSRILLSDNADLIRKKIGKAKTDTQAGITYDPDERPEVANLLRIMSSSTGRSVDALVEEYGGCMTGVFKGHVSDALVEHMRPITLRSEQLRADPGYVRAVLRDGAERANEISSRNMSEIRRMVGLHSSL